MNILLDNWPFFVAMFLLMCGSAFFSGSEAAFFSLGTGDRKALAQGGFLGRLVDRLLAKPERLLSAVLLGNLMVNLTFFTLSAILMFKLRNDGQAALGGILSLVNLFALIIFSEMLPKDIAVLAPRPIATLTALPISWVVRLLAPIMPVLDRVNLLSRRLFFPKFVAEPYLRVADLERAVELSKTDAALLRREQRVLQNIVSLSDITAEEMMRPRALLKTFRPPVSLDDVAERLGMTLPLSGYLVITEPTTEEIAAAVSLRRLYRDDTRTAWQETSAPVVYVPWSVSVAAVLEQLRSSKREVAAVVNEYGETIGILTLDDIIETLFARDPSRSRRLHLSKPIRKIGANLWHVGGLTNLRRVSRELDVTLPFHESVTVGGLLQEILERFPEIGDVCDFGPCTFRVLEISDDHAILAELRLNT